MSAAGERLETVFFDLGDTLWHFPARTPSGVIERVLGKRFRARFSLWGVRPQRPPEAIYRALERAVLAAERAADAGDLRSPDYLGLTRRVAADAGLELSAEQIAELWEAHHASGVLLGRRLFDDTHETLQWMIDRGLRLGAITNRAHGGEAFLHELRHHELLRYFEVVTSSDRAGWRKPHPAIFEQALSAMGATPEHSALVGDRLEADVRGARAIGMTAIWLRRAAEPSRPENQPDYAIDGLGDLRSVPPIARRS